MCNLDEPCSSDSASKQWYCPDGKIRHFNRKTFRFCIPPTVSVDSSKKIIGAVVGALVAGALAGLFFFMYKDPAKFCKLVVSLLLNEVVVTISMGFELWDFVSEMYMFLM